MSPGVRGRRRAPRTPRWSRLPGPGSSHTATTWVGFLVIVSAVLVLVLGALAIVRALPRATVTVDSSACHVLVGGQLRELVGACIGEAR